MKVFVTVVMLVTIFIVLTTDVVWRIAPPSSLVPGGSGQESSKAAKDRVSDSDEKKTQTQQPQQNAGNVPVLSAEPETKRAQAANQQSGGKVDPDEQPFGGIKMVLGIITVALMAVGVVIAYRSLFTHRVTSGASLSVDEWKLHGLKEDKPAAACWIVNAGIDATIIDSRFGYRLREQLPPTVDYRQSISLELEGRTIPAKGRRPLYLRLPFATEGRKEILPHDKTSAPRKALYIFICLTYKDEFRSHPEKIFFVKYNPAIEQFQSIGAPPHKPDTKC
jgi:hypothetical protein